MIKNILKLSIASGLISWLIKSGKLDFNIIVLALKNPSNYALGFGLLFTQCVINAVRWKFILSTQTKERVPSIFVIMATWVGMFFNTVLPGAVSGDFVKMMYLKKIDESLTKTSMFITVMMDRIYGLISLILITGIISVTRFNYLVGLNENIRRIIYANMVLLTGILVFVGTLFASEKFRAMIIHFVTKIPKAGNQVAHIFECFWNVGKNKVVFFKSIGISILGQTFGLSAFYIFSSPFIDSSIQYVDIFTFVPIGMIVTAVPLGPGGMGVGHVAFSQLFNYLGATNGADLFNIFWVTMLSINLLGVIPYLILGGSKKKQITNNERVGSL